MDQRQFNRACYRTCTLVLIGCGIDADTPRPEPKRRPDDPVQPEHCLWMLDEANQFYIAGKIEKANRWLGYVQGVVAARGWATLDELKRANMPDDADFDAERV